MVSLELSYNFTVPVSGTEARFGQRHRTVSIVFTIVSIVFTVVSIVFIIVSIVLIIVSIVFTIVSIYIYIYVEDSRLT